MILLQEERDYEEFLADPTYEPDGSCIDETEEPAFVIR